VIISMTATAPEDVLEQVIQHYDKEGPRLRRLAGLTTGRERKDREAQALYADAQAAFWANIVLDDAR
jgi:hypothetical protein